MERIPITREALEKLKNELSHLEKVERPDNIRAIEEARRHGDISENAEYHAAKEKQSFLDAKMSELKAAIGKAEVIGVDDGPTDRVVFGRRVLLYNIQTEDVRNNAIEILKMRYSKHEKKIVLMEISENGMKVYPDKRVLLKS